MPVFIIDNNDLQVPQLLKTRSASMKAKADLSVHEKLANTVAVTTTVSSYTLLHSYTTVTATTVLTA